MAYISPKQLFVQDLLSRGISQDDVQFLADLQFDEDGDPKTGSLYEIYRKQ